MESEHRKVELQSPGDLTYLAAQIRTAARKKLDLHLPPQPDTTEPDELRKRVEELVEAFVAQVLSGMRHNISINGIDVIKRGGEGEDGGDAMEGVDDGVAEAEEFEPFDDKLRARLGATVQKRDQLIAKISQHRRTTPALAARRFEEQFAKEMEGLEAARVEGETMAVQGAESDVVGIEALSRQDEVQRNWEKAVESLGRLNKELPETRAKLERCGGVTDELGGKRGTT